MTTWQELNNAMAGTVADVRQSLVQIRSDEGNIGAGTIWHEDGLVITNAHVILDRHRVRDNLTVVLPDDSLYDATVLSYDRERDIAALSIEGDAFPTIQVGNSDDIHAGQWAMALGHPWGVVDSLTSGIIIGRGNNLPERGDGQDWLALSLKLRPGHSGGPLLDNAGKLIGINTMISGPDIGFAIPVNDVKAFLKETLGGFTAESDEVVAIV